MSRIDVLLIHPKRTLGVLARPQANAWRARPRPHRRGDRCRLRRELLGLEREPQQHVHRWDPDHVQLQQRRGILNASNWKPGDTQTGTVDIANTGSLAGTFTLSRSALSNSDGTNPMSDKINLVVKDCGDFSSGTPTCDAGDPVKYSGTLTAMTSNAALGTLAANEKHRYQFAATFDSSAGNVYQGGSSTATFTWNAVQ